MYLINDVFKVSHIDNGFITESRINKSVVTLYHKTLLDVLNHLDITYGEIERELLKKKEEKK